MQQVSQTIILDVLIENTKSLLQEAQDEELYDAISIAFKKKKELTTLFLKNQEWIDEFLEKGSTSNKSTCAEIFEKVELEEKAIAIARFESTTFINEITKNGWYFNKDNFKVLQMMIVNSYRRR